MLRFTEIHLMHIRLLGVHFLILSFLTVILFLTSCVANKRISYFQDFSDSARIAAVIKTVPFKNPVIKPDDVLSITIQTIDNTVTSPVNTTNSTSAGTQATNGYLVNSAGEVELPFIGKIKLSGLTTSQAQDSIRKEADKLFNSPIINVRYANFKITILGEVNRPSTYVMPSEKITLFDAIGLAGDLTIYGKRDNVLLVRDSANDNRQIVRLNLDSKNIISSPYFYLQPNDMIYVEPNKSRVASTDVQQGRTLAIVSTSIAVLAFILSRVKF